MFLLGLALSVAQVQEAYDISERLCPASTKVAMRIDNPAKAAELMVIAMRKNGVNDEQINLVLKFCTMYTNGAIDMGERKFAN